MKKSALEIINTIIEKQDELCTTAKNKIKISETEEREIKYLSEKGIGIICQTEINEISDYSEGNKHLKETDIDEAFNLLDDIIFYTGFCRACDESEQQFSSCKFMDGLSVIDVDEALKERKDLKKAADEKTKKEQKIYKDAKATIKEAAETNSKEDRLTGDESEKAAEEEKGKEKDGTVKKGKSTWPYSFEALNKYTWGSGKIISPRDFALDKLSKGISAIENAEFNLYTMGPKLILMLARGISTGVGMFKSIRKWFKDKKKKDVKSKVDECLKAIAKAEKKKKIPE